MHAAAAAGRRLPQACRAKLMLDALIRELQASRGLAHKRDIAEVVRTLGVADPGMAVPVGDDCAAIPDGEGWLLFATEGFINEFVEKDPWFAGWCGVMFNVADVYAMGGRPIAVVDAAWSRSEERMRPVLEGLAAASQAYGVPVVGGHSNTRCDREQLSVSIVGRARRLLTSFDAQPGDLLVAAIDLRGSYRQPYPHWNASTGVDAARLRADLELLPQLAEDGLCRAAKDISQAGLLGTTMMLLECSGVGATIEVNAVPRPPEAPLKHWLVSTFPSYGFVLSVVPHCVDAVLARFYERDLACKIIGRCDNSRTLRLHRGSENRMAWNFRESPLLGCGAGAWAAQPPRF